METHKNIQDNTSLIYSSTDKNLKNIFPKLKSNKVVVWLNGKATKEPGRLRSPSSKPRESLKVRCYSSLVGFCLKPRAVRVKRATSRKKTVTLEIPSHPKTSLLVSQIGKVLS